MDEAHSPPATAAAVATKDIDKLKQKLQRAYLRRDHYAQLYYHTKTELEDTKWHLSVAMNKIKQLQTQMSKYKGESVEYGRISPDSGAISMSPGVESTEGHAQLEDEALEGPTENHRLSKSNSKMNGMSEMLNSSVDIKATRKVAFREQSGGPITNNNTSPQHTNNSSYEKLNGHHQQQPMFKRSLTYEQGEFAAHQQQQHFMDLKMQRTASFNQVHHHHQAPPPPPPPSGGPMQFSTFPPGSYPMMQQQTPLFTSSNFSLQMDHHRLPRVHRGMNYDGMQPPPPPPGGPPSQSMVGSPYQQPPPPPRILQQQQQQHHQQQQQQPVQPRAPGLPPQQSAFQRVPKQGGSLRMQPHHNHHQYENITVRPQYFSLPPNHPAHFMSPPPPPPHISQQAPPPPLSHDHQHQYTKQHHQPQPSYGERWTYSGLSQEEFLQLLNHLSNPNTKVERLEISRSNLGRPDFMNSLCKELRRNTSIIELSLPNNDIGRDSLKILLSTIANTKNIRELKLVNNDIGDECLDVLKQFLEHCTLKVLILSDNEIEHHTHLLDAQLPQDLQYEGIPSSKTSPASPEITQDMKLLQI